MRKKPEGWLGGFTPRNLNENGNVHDVTGLMLNGLLVIRQSNAPLVRRTKGTVRGWMTSVVLEPDEAAKLMQVCADYLASVAHAIQAAAEDTDVA